jgi:hypothetical protein
VKLDAMQPSLFPLPLNEPQTPILAAVLPNVIFSPKHSFLHWVKKLYNLLFQ